MKLTKRDMSLIKCLRENSRMSLTEISKKTKIPISTLYDRLRLQQKQLGLKHTTILNFKDFGFGTKAHIFLKSNITDRSKLENYLKFNDHVNSLFKSTNRFDFIVEGVFKEVEEVDSFLEDLEKRFPSIQYDTHFIVKDLLRESFLKLNN